MKQKGWTTTVALVGVAAALGLLAGCGTTGNISGLPTPATQGSTASSTVINYGVQTIPFGKPFVPPTSADILVNGIRVAKDVLQPLPASANVVSPSMYKEDQLVLLGALESDENGLRKGSFHAPSIKGDTIESINFNRVFANTGLSTSGVVFNLELMANGHMQTIRIWTALDSQAKRFGIGVVN